MLVIPLLLSQLAYAETAKDPGEKHISPTQVTGKTMNWTSRSHFDLCTLYTARGEKTYTTYWRDTRHGKCNPRAAKIHNAWIMKNKYFQMSYVNGDQTITQSTVSSKDVASVAVFWTIAAAVGFVLYKSTGPHEPLF